VLKIRNKQLPFGSRTFVMGIVNITPDSFSGDGVLDLDVAVAKALSQIADGADIIDLGGQSTRPGHTPVDEETEAKRVLPVIAALRKVSDVIISVDTFVPSVLKRAIDAGADMLNSIWGLNEPLLDIIKQAHMPVVITHNKSERLYPSGVVADVIDQLQSQAKMALAAGLEREQVILDFGFGFGKDADQSLEIFASLKELSALGFPTLVGTSRKSTIGKVTGRVAQDRIFGTAATVALAIAYGVDIVRVHDVREMVEVVKMSDAIIRGWRPDEWRRDD
jgi:dihydropteroate synthase